MQEMMICSKFDIVTNGIIVPAVLRVSPATLGI